MSKRPLSSISTMLKMGLLCVGVLVALAFTSPSPPLSDAASKQEIAANEMARAQLEQLKMEMASGKGNETIAADEQSPEPLSPEQEKELKRIRERLLLAEQPLNLVEEPKDNTLDDPALADLARLQAQANEQAKNVQPFINQEIEDKRAMLAAEEARLRLERQSMEQLKEDIDKRLAELKGVQKAVEDITNLEQKAAEAKNQTQMTQEERKSKVLQVSKFISQMKSAAAAQVVSKLTPELAVEVMSNISPRVAGKIMNSMDPLVAAAISKLMAKRDQLLAARQTEAALDQEVEDAMRAAGVVAQNAAAPAQQTQQQPQQQPQQPPQTAPAQQ